jgi:Kef-type K+ transport system membrane component KefB
MELFLQIGFLIIIASALALLLYTLRIPSVIAYILTGILAGYFGFKPASEDIDIMIELGIILLLFLAGLEIKLKGIVELGKKTLIIGEGHDIIMAVVSFILAFFVLKLNMLASFYLAIGLTLSSTIVVVKALTNRKELATPHGKILVGTMVLQDIIAMTALAVFSSLGTGTTILSGLGMMFLKGLIIFFVLIALGRFILPKVFYYAAQSIELLFLVALGWLFLGVSLSGFIGFSTTIGSFLAALAISDLPFSFEITDKVKGLRDFGILLFFLSVGFQLQITKALLLNWQFYMLIVFILLFTPFITSIVAGFLRFTKKEIFIMSTLPTQVSEFTLILITFGFSAGHLSLEIYSMITLVIVATIIFSSLIIENLNKIYKRIQHKIDFIEWKHAEHPPHLKKDLKNHIVIFGFGRLGQYIAEFYKKKKKDVLVVDWEPESMDAAKQLQCLHVFGDAGDSDLWEEIRLDKVDVVISTIGKNQEDDINLIKWMKQNNSKALKIAETNLSENARELYKKGADIVLVHDDLEWNDLKLYLKSNPAKRKKLKKIFEV